LAGLKNGISTIVTLAQLSGPVKVEDIKPLASDWIQDARRFARFTKKAASAIALESVALQTAIITGRGVGAGL
jgi:hypothetical protein